MSDGITYANVRVGESIVAVRSVGAYDLRGYVTVTLCTGIVLSTHMSGSLRIGRTLA